MDHQKVNVSPFSTWARGVWVGRLRGWRASRRRSARPSGAAWGSPARTARTSQSSSPSLTSAPAANLRIVGATFLIRRRGVRRDFTSVSFYSGISRRLWGDEWGKGEAPDPARAPDGWELEAELGIMGVCKLMEWNKRRRLTGHWLVAMASRLHHSARNQRATEFVLLGKNKT